MTIEQQALALVNEVRVLRKYEPYQLLEVQTDSIFIAMVRALERHEADKLAWQQERQEVSEAVKERFNGTFEMPTTLSRFIIAPPVDPIEAAVDELWELDGVTTRELLRIAIKRGMEFVKHGLAIRKEA